MKNILIVLIVAVLACLLIPCGVAFSFDQNESFEVCRWEVGQFVEYIIESLENEGRDNRYRIEIFDKETLPGGEYFWVKLDIFESGIKQISFKGLVKPFSSMDFAKHPSLFLSEGIKVLFLKAERLFIVIDDSEYEINPNVFLVQPDILKDTFYQSIPDQKNTVDYGKLEISTKKNEIITAAGNFECYHLRVNSSEKDAYTDEGFDLWRTFEVPFLGIVKAEFSKTEYAKKREYRFLELLRTQTWTGKIYAKLFLGKVKSRNRSDMHTITLIDYKN